MDEYKRSDIFWPGNWGPNPTLYHYSNPNQLQEYISPNATATEYSDANLFETGAPSLCALKTKIDGRFYVPNKSFVNATSLRVEWLFDNANVNLTGDQTGGASPYPAIANYPSFTVDGKDVTFIAGKFGKAEGTLGWDYMADAWPDGKIDGKDIYLAASHFGGAGSYGADLSGVSIAFNVGGNETPDAIGFAPIPPTAANFTVTRYGTTLGAMIIFCGP